jgi:hypothetical protein
MSLHSSPADGTFSSTTGLAVGLDTLEGALDRQTEQARRELGTFRDRTGIATAARDPRTTDHVLDALARLTGSYIAAGARSYAQQICVYAISLSDDQGWNLGFEQLILQLESELEEPEIHQLDAHWREFFGCGERTDVVLQACFEADQPLLARRVAALHAFFSAKGPASLPPDEMFLPLVEGADGSCRFVPRI